MNGNRATGTLFVNGEAVAEAIEIQFELEAVPVAKQYRTEKRKARVGERILITDAVRTFEYYDNGDVFTVKRFSMYDSGVMAEELKGDAPYVGHDEYEVIIEETQPTPSLATRVTELEAKVTELETQLAEKSKPVEINTTIIKEPLAKLDMAKISEAFREFARAAERVKKTPNQRRADVIKQARAFVADLESSIIFRKTTFHVNAEKGVVTALSHGIFTGKLHEKAFAKCAPGDVFNADIGKAIAAGRLYGVKVPAEFFSAPKPTEVVVGMRVKGSYGGEYQVERFCDDEISNKAHGRPFRIVGSSGWVGTKQVAIIDDTDAQYEVSA